MSRRGRSNDRKRRKNNGRAAKLSTLNRLKRRGLGNPRRRSEREFASRSGAGSGTSERLGKPSEGVRRVKRPSAAGAVFSWRFLNVGAAAGRAFCGELLISARFSDKIRKSRRNDERKNAFRFGFDALLNAESASGCVCRRTRKKEKRR